MNKCPMCGKSLATYQVSRLGDDGVPQEREVGCAKENAPCLLAGHSWPLSKWDDVCDLVASADEGYPGAADDALRRESMLMCLVNKWRERADFLSYIVPGDGSALRVLRVCIDELDNEITREAK